MVMGPTHSISAAAGWLVGVSVYSTLTSTPVDPAVALMGTAVAAGAALAPDIDSHSSTVVNSLGFVGKGLHQVVNVAGVTVQNVTATKYDQHVTNGHRTLFHTGVAAVLAGVGTALATLSTSPAFTLSGTTLSWGQVGGLIIMAVLLDLALGGLFEKQIKRARKKYGPYLLLVASMGLTLLTAFLLPPADGHVYSWLGIAVGFGWFMHLLGDLITKMGVPLLWPLRIKGKAWWDVSLPSFMRISAGGVFEKVILLPLLSIITVIAAIYVFLLWSGVLPDILSRLGVA